MSHRIFQGLASAATLSGFLLAAAIHVPAASAADDQGRAATGRSAAPSSGHIIGQSIAPGIPVSGSVHPLHLSDAQRARIRDVLATKDTEVDLNLKKHKSVKSFEPRIDEKVPKNLKGQAFPQPLITEMPAVRGYEYLKFKGNVLIVNPLTRKIVDMFPERTG